MVKGTGSRFLQFSRRTVLATNGMVAMATLGADREYEVSAVAEKAGASVEEIRTVVPLLERAGLVYCNGSGGTRLRLCRKPDTVTLLDVARAVGEDFESHGRTRGLASRSPLVRALEEVNDRLRDVVAALFKAKTVGELANGRV